MQVATTEHAPEFVLVIHKSCSLQSIDDCRECVRHAIDHQALGQGAVGLAVERHSQLRGAAVAVCKL
jgi:hypothetical protein